MSGAPKRKDASSRTQAPALVKEPVEDASPALPPVKREASAPTVSALGLPVSTDEQYVGPYEYIVIASILLVALVTRYYGLTDPAGVVRAKCAVCVRSARPFPLPPNFLGLWLFRPPLALTHQPRPTPARILPCATSPPPYSSCTYTHPHTRAHTHTHTHAQRRTRTIVIC